MFDCMQNLKYFFLFFPVFLFGQDTIPIAQDSIVDKYLIIEGDSIPRKNIELDAVLVMPKMLFSNKKERIDYIILKRKIHKVYPYAKMAAERLTQLNHELSLIGKRRKKKKHAKEVQKFIEREFSKELKKLTKTEGQILVKLIHRQTGKTAFDLVKELRNGWRAFWYNNTASLFSISLKKEFTPLKVEEDFLIEDILLRAFQNEQLVRQEPAFEIDYYALTSRWLNIREKSKSKN